MPTTATEVPIPKTDPVTLKCDFCGAEPGEPCRTKVKEENFNHATRRCQAEREDRRLATERLNAEASRPPSSHYEVETEVENEQTAFRHRIVLIETTGEQSPRARTVVKESRWTAYEGIAQLDDVRHCTDYYNGILPTEQLFRVVPL